MNKRNRLAILNPHLGCVKQRQLTGKFKNERTANLSSIAGPKVLIWRMRVMTRGTVLVHLFEIQILMMMVMKTSGWVLSVELGRVRAYGSGIVFQPPKRVPVYGQ